MIEDEPINQLSSAGLQRREEILGDLLGNMQRLHHKRRVYRKVMTAMIVPIVMISALTLWWLTASNITKSSNPQQARSQDHSTTGPFDAPPDEKPEQPAAAIIVRVQTDPTIVDRWRTTATATAQTFIVIDDDALLMALNEISRPAGLIRSEGHIWLSAPVTDKALNAARRGS